MERALSTNDDTIFPHTDILVRFSPWPLHLIFFMFSLLVFQVNSVNWSDYANRAFTFVEDPFIIAPLADDDIKEDPNLAYELIIHKEINSSRNAYRCDFVLLAGRGTGDGGEGDGGFCSVGIRLG